MNTNTYRNNSYPLHRLLHMAEAGQVAIPNIQRPYVWSPAQLARYMDSLMHGWPCGSLLLWHTSREKQNIFGSRQFAHLHCTPGASPEEELPQEAAGYEYLILDGQQRLQSLVLALSAKAEGYCATTYEWRRDMGNTGGRRTEAETRLLCFNLRGWSPEIQETMPSFYYLDYEEDELENTPCLQWRTEEEIRESGGAYVPLCRLPESSERYPEALAWLRELAECCLQSTEIPVLEVYQTGHFVERMEDDETIVQIFTRLNTAGTPLTKEQIQAARIKSLWPRFPEHIDSLSDELSKAPYLLLLNTDDLVNGFNITLRAWYRTADISAAYARASAEGSWGEIWGRFAAYTRQCITALQDKKMFCNAEYKSLYVLWFPVAHLSCRNTGITEETARQMVKWALVTGWARIWANRSGQYVRSMMKRLVERDESQSTCQWLQSILTGSQRDEQLITAACNSIDNLAASHRGSVRQYYLPLWVWTRMDSQRTNFVLGFGSNSFAVDHIVPISWVQDPNIKAIYNSLGNCWMLSSAANGTKSNDSFYTFLKNYGIDTANEETTDGVAVLLNCDSSHLAATPESQPDARFIREREQKIKNDLKRYIEGEVELFFPSEERIRRNDYQPDVSSIYRGEEYVQTAAFTRLGVGTRSSYLSHIRTAIGNLQLQSSELEQMKADELQQLLESAAEQKNAAPGWRNYLRFLRGDRRATTVQAVRSISLKQGIELYRGVEFLSSTFMTTKNDRSQQSYLSNIRKAMRDLNLVASDLANMKSGDYEKLLDEAHQLGNCASAWRSYLNFLLDKEPVTRTTTVTMTASGLNTQGIYLGEEYTQSPDFSRMAPGSQRCHVTGIRKAIELFNLSADSAVWSDNAALEQLQNHGREALTANYASYWRKYINFLLRRL